MSSAKPVLAEAHASITVWPILQDFLWTTDVSVTGVTTAISRSTDGDGCMAKLRKVVQRVLLTHLTPTENSIAPRDSRSGSTISLPAIRTETSLAATSLAPAVPTVNEDAGKTHVLFGAHQPDTVTPSLPVRLVGDAEILEQPGRTPTVSERSHGSAIGSQNHHSHAEQHHDLHLSSFVTEPPSVSHETQPVSLPSHGLHSGVPRLRFAATTTDGQTNSPKPPQAAMSPAFTLVDTPKSPVMAVPNASGNMSPLQGPDPSSNQYTSITFAMRPLIQWQWLLAATRYSIAGIRLWAVWYFVFAVLFIIPVSIFRVDHPALLAVMFVGWICFSLAALLKMDVTLWWALLRQFEVWYLLFLLLVLLINAVYAVHDSEGGAFQLVFWGGLCLTSLYTIELDAFIALTASSRFCILIVDLALYCLILVRENIEREMRTSSVCVFFCTDTRRLALLGLTNLFFFMIRYTALSLSNSWRAPRLVVLRVPISCTLVRHRDVLATSHTARALHTPAVDQAAASPASRSAEPLLKASSSNGVQQGTAESPNSSTRVLGFQPEPSPALGATGAVNNSQQNLLGLARVDTLTITPARDTQTAYRRVATGLSSSAQLRRMRSLGPQALRQLYVRIETRLSPDQLGLSVPAAESPAERAMHSSDAAVNKASPHDYPSETSGFDAPPEPHTYRREFPFRPLNRNYWCYVVAHSQWYQLFLPAFMLVYVVIHIFGAIQVVAINWTLFALMLMLVPIETTRYDRTILRSLFRRFEYYIVLISGLQYIVFGVWSQHLKYDLAAVIPSFTAALILHVGLASMDAAPMYPHWLRLVSVLLYVLNAARVFVMTRALDTRYEPFPVCVLFCTNTAVLSFSGLFTSTLFFCKYLVNLSRNRQHSIILTSAIAYKVNPAVAVPSEPRPRLVEGRAVEVLVAGHGASSPRDSVMMKRRRSSATAAHETLAATSSAFAPAPTIQAAAPTVLQPVPEMDHRAPVHDNDVPLSPAVPAPLHRATSGPRRASVLITSQLRHTSQSAQRTDIRAATGQFVSVFPTGVALSSFAPDQKAGDLGAWNVYFDQDGVPYYYNAQTRRSVWEIPSEESPEPSHADPPGDHTDPQLPSQQSADESDRKMTDRHTGGDAHGAGAVVVNVNVDDRDQDAVEYRERESIIRSTNVPPNVALSEE